jgi:cell division protein FtsL
MAMVRKPDAAQAIGFAIPKDVQNHAVREVDRARQRELWWMVVGGAVLVGGLVLWVWQDYQWRALGYQQAELQRESAALEAEARHLTVEIATLSSLERIELLATRDLKLVAPLQTQAVVIERVQQAARPARTLVALR